MTTPKPNGRIRIEPKITVGNLIQLVILVVAALAVFFGLGGRVTILEKEVSAMEQQATEFVTEKVIIVELREIKRRLTSIEEKLDKRK